MTFPLLLLNFGQSINFGGLLGVFFLACKVDEVAPLNPRCIWAASQASFDLEFRLSMLKSDSLLSVSSWISNFPSSQCPISRKWQWICRHGSGWFLPCRSNNLGDWNDQVRKSNCFCFFQDTDDDLLFVMQQLLGKLVFCQPSWHLAGVGLWLITRQKESLFLWTAGPFYLEFPLNLGKNPVNYTSQKPSPPAFQKLSNLFWKGSC